MKVLQDIWILEKSGIVIFHRVFDEVVSPQLFGAMMSALNMFAEQLTDGGLSNFELNNKGFTINKSEELLFIANSAKKHKQKKVNKALEKVTKKFLKLYADKVKDFKGEIGVYSEFKEVIEDTLEDKTDEFWKGLM